MHIKPLPDQSIEIYLQVAKTASAANDSVMTLKMLNAAYEQISYACRKPGAKTLTNLAEMLLIHCKKTEAEEVYLLALKICKQSAHNDDWLLARICDGLTEIYASQSHFEKARKKCQQAIKILSAIPEVDPVLLSSRVRKLAWLNLNQGNAGKAIELLNTSLEF